MKNTLLTGILWLFSARALALQVQYPLDNYEPGSFRGRVFACCNPRHLGEDHAATPLTPVYAIADGQVLTAEVSGAHCNFGMVVVIEHTLDDGNKFVSLYGHLSNRVGYRPRLSGTVREGEVIGHVAHSGGRPPAGGRCGPRDDENGDGGPHLHFAIRLGVGPRRSNGRYEWIYPGYAGRYGQDVDFDTQGTPRGGFFTNPARFLELLGVNDQDADGYTISEGDCMDTGMTPEGVPASAIHPGATEVCNYTDDDCDGATDEGFPGLLTSCTVGIGACQNSGVNVCTTDFMDTACSVVPYPPSPETCDGEDDDCDGTTDEGSNPCGGVCLLPGPPGSACDGSDGDLCVEGTYSCAGPNTLACSDTTSTNVEVCDYVDNDCDGITDEGFPGLLDPCTVGIGACERTGTVVCTTDTMGTACSLGPGLPSPEVCNGLDNDCDGIVDDSVCVSWSSTTTLGAPEPRNRHTAIWTGSEMIVWGGITSLGWPNAAGRYDPATDSWSATLTTGVLLGRDSHTAIWTGDEMIVWGGTQGISENNTGGRYNPATDSWSATPTVGAPSARTNHSAIWTGSEMIVWGGYNGLSEFNSGGRYNPATNSWIATATSDAPSPRYSHTAIWTGDEMIVWGGVDLSLTPFNTGGKYDPGVNTWTVTATSGAPGARWSHTSIWTESEMIVWGGFDGAAYFNTGGRYNPSTDGWTFTSTASVPAARQWHTSSWTGSEIIVWGGNNGLINFYTGGRYNPITSTWTITGTTDAPSARSFHSAIWTGSEMIVWGGYYVPSGLNTGGRYTPP